MGADESVPVGCVVIELRCCCCGRVLEELWTRWSVDYVRPEHMYTRLPCAPCRLEFQAEFLQRS